MSAVDHSADQISQEAIEQLEMRRLGLPLSFGSRKNRRAKRKKKDEKNAAAAATYRKVEQQTAVRKDAVAAGASRNPPPPSAFVSAAHRSPPPDGFELIDFDDHEEEEEADAAELMAGVEEADVTSLGSSGGGSGPDEVATLKLADDSYDFIELDKLRISVSADDEDCADQQQQQVMNKRDRSEDDNMTTTSSEISREDQLLLTSSSSSSKPKKKRSKRQLNTTYFKQRFLLFSRFNEGIRLDRESWYSVTPEPIARHIAERIERALIRHSAASTSPSSSANQFIILDGFCGAGGNTIQFALMPSTALVYAVDIDPRKIELARHNASIYGCLDKIQFIVADFFEVIQGDRLPCSLVDACFLSPPWGGPDYLTYESYSLAQMTPDGFEIARRVADRVTKNISFLLPRNFDMGELPSLSSIVYQNDVGGGEMEKSVEIEENMLYKKVKTLTAYFGHLVIRKEGDDGGGSGDGGADEKEVSALFKTAQVCSPPPIYLADEEEEEE